MKRIAFVAIVILFTCICSLVIADRLVIPAEVKHIEREAFYGNTSIEEVILPEGIEQIGPGAFADSSVTLVEFPASEFTIDDTAFQGTQMIGTGLRNTYAQSWCTEHGFQYIVKSTPAECFTWEAISATEARITGYTGTDTELIIPDEIDGLMITEIKASTFASNKQVTSVVLPYYLRTVSSTLFYKCSNLTEVTIRENVEQISGSAFGNCSKLENVVFQGESKLNIVSYSSFENCSGLREMTLPDSVTTIGPAAFRNCTALEYFRFPLSWSKMESVSVGVRYGSIFAGCRSLKSVDIPDGVQAIPDYAFGNDEYLEEVHIAESVRRIGNGAFYNNKSLTTIAVSTGLEEIGDNTFSGCVNLSEMIGLSESSLTKVGYCAFENCSSLESIDFPDSVQSIGQAAFRYCTGITSFRYPRSWETVTGGVIGGVAAGSIFKGCTNLTSVIVPEGVTAIPKMAFANCESLQEVILPSSLKMIEGSAFLKAESITEINLPAGVESIGESAFEECNALRQVNGLSECAITRIEHSTFEDCVNLTAVNLPDSVEVIAPAAFMNCSSLQSFHYPSAWREVAYVVIGGVPYGSIFRGCTLLTEIVVPDGVKEIPEYAFCNSNCLKKVQLPSSVKKIGKEAFYGAGAMEEIYLSEYITEIGASAFENCPDLTIYCEWATYALSYAKNSQLNYYYLSLTNTYRLIHDSTVVNQMYQGDSYSLYGYVRSSQPVSRIHVVIRDSSNTAVIDETVTPDETDVLLNNVLSGVIRFETLGLGTYHLTMDATAGGITERMSQSSFTVVPPPVRIVSEDLNVPKGVTDPAFRISGTINANYSIYRITVSLWNEFETILIHQKTVDVSGTSFNLAGIANEFDFSTLGFGAYIFTIDLYTDGGDCEDYIHNMVFPLQNKTQYTDDQLEAILSFTRNINNKYVFGFARAYADDYFYREIDQDTTLFEFGPIKLTCNPDAFFIAFNDYKDIAWGKVNETFTGRDTYLIDLYKGQIMAVLKEMSGKDLPTSINKNDFVVEVLDWIASSGGTVLKIDKLGIVDNTILKEGASIIKPFEDLFDAVKQAKPSIELANELNRGIAYSLAENLYEISIIEAIQNSMAEGTDVNSEAFGQAMQEVYNEYAAEGYGVVVPIVRQAIELAKGENIKHILKLVGEDTGAVYSVANFAIKAFNKVSGLSDLSKSRKTFLKTYDNACFATRAYGNAFEAVLKGDTSAEALNQLYFTYCYARASWKSMMDYLKTNWLPDDVLAFDADHRKIKNMKFPGIE